MFEVPSSFVLFILQISNPGPHFHPKASPHGKDEAPTPPAAVPTTLHLAQGATGHSGLSLSCDPPPSVSQPDLAAAPPPLLCGPSTPCHISSPHLRHRLVTVSVCWLPGWLLGCKPWLWLIRCVRLGKVSSWAFLCTNWGEDCTFAMGRPCRHAGQFTEHTGTAPAGTAPAAVSASSTCYHSQTFWNTHIF